MKTANFTISAILFFYWMLMIGFSGAATIPIIIYAVMALISVLMVHFLGAQIFKQ